MKTGKVIKSTGSNYWVLIEDKVVIAKLVGKLRLLNSKHTNPVSVGDEVILSDDFQTIVDIIDRKNYLVRKSTNLSKQTHVIAANLDEIFIVASIKQPRTSLGFIDRLLVTAAAYQIPCSIIFNKIDLLNEEEKSIVEEWQAMYKYIGYKSYAISAINEQSKSLINKLIQDKTVLFVGHSGVGKSTILNTIIPDKALKTGQISTKHEKGMHTTTFAEMFPINALNSFVIDTPGIKEFGLYAMEKHELSTYFPEMFKIKENCRFNNCLHVNEPNCAVLKNVENGEIPLSRYENYLNMLNNIEETLK